MMANKSTALMLSDDVKLLSFYVLDLLAAINFLIFAEVSRFT